MLHRLSVASIVFCLLGLILIESARADVPPDPGLVRKPARQGGSITRDLSDVHRPLTVRVDRSQATSRIVIPQAYLAAVRNTSAAAPAAAPSGADPASDVRRRAILAGVSLSLLLAGGFLTLAFARQRRRSLAVVTTTAAVAGMLLLVGTALADLLPPGVGDSPGYPPQGRRPQAPPPQIAIETVDGGSAVVLILGRDAVDAIR